MGTHTGPGTRLWHRGLVGEMGRSSRRLFPAPRASHARSPVSARYAASLRAPSLRATPLRGHARRRGTSSAGRSPGSTRVPSEAPSLPDPPCRSERPPCSSPPARGGGARMLGPGCQGSTGGSGRPSAGGRERPAPSSRWRDREGRHLVDGSPGPQEPCRPKTPVPRRPATARGMTRATRQCRRQSRSCHQRCCAGRCGRCRSSRPARRRARTGGSVAGDSPAPR